MGERGLARKGKGGNIDREIIGQYEGGGWQRGKEAPHLACALGPATWGSGPDFLDASTHLHKRLCPSVGWSVGPSVGPSVTLL